MEAQGALSRCTGRLLRIRHPVVVLEEIQSCRNPQVRFAEVDEDTKVGDSIGGQIDQFNSIILQNSGKEGVNWEPKSAFDVCEENRNFPIFTAWRMLPDC